MVIFDVFLSADTKLSKFYRNNNFKKNGVKETKNDSFKIIIFFSKLKTII